MGDDRKYYLVKFLTRDDHTVLNEMLCGHLAMRFGLPSIEPVIVTVNGLPLKQINEKRAEAGLALAEQGAHFGVEFIEPFYTVESLDEAGVSLTSETMDNLNDVPSILGFDTMVQNNDRHPGNTAVVSDATGKGYSYRVFDFGHAFGGPKWTTSTLEQTYRIMAPIVQFCLITDNIDAPGDFERFLREFESHIVEWLDDLLAILPPELGSDTVADAEAVKSALATLERSALERAILGAPVLR